MCVCGTHRSEAERKQNTQTNQKHRKERKRKNNKTQTTKKTKEKKERKAKHTQTKHTKESTLTLTKPPELCKEEFVHNLGEKKEKEREAPP